MNRLLILMPLILLSCKRDCRVKVEDEVERGVVVPARSGAEGMELTLEQDLLTYEKALLAFEEGGEENWEASIFELLSLDDSVGGEGLNPDVMTYQRALEAVYETDPAIAKQKAVLKKKRAALVKMIGNEMSGEDFEEAKADYERARDLLGKLKVESSALYRKE